MATAAPPKKKTPAKKGGKSAPKKAPSPSKAPAKPAPDKSSPSRASKSEGKSGRKPHPLKGKLKQSPDPDNYWTVQELSQEIDVTVKTIHKWCVEGKLNARQATDKDKEQGWSRGQWMIPKKGFKRPAGWMKVE